MAGHIIECFPRRTVDFTGLAVGSTHEYILADKVVIAYWKRVVLQIHVHTLASAAGTILIGAYGQTVSELDPGMQFIDETQFASVTLPSSGAPIYLPLELSPNGGNSPG